ncbi:MAG: hypothetical protein RL281_1909, partial [Pseudomonadota bacterium]
MFEHPRPAMVRVPNGQSGHVLIGQAARDFQQI